MNINYKEEVLKEYPDAAPLHFDEWMEIYTGDDRKMLSSLFKEEEKAWEEAYLTHIKPFRKVKVEKVEDLPKDFLQEYFEKLIQRIFGEIETSIKVNEDDINRSEYPSEYVIKLLNEIK